MMKNSSLLLVIKYSNIDFKITTSMVIDIILFKLIKQMLQFKLFTTMNNNNNK